ncbi:hypothetical protein VTI28DRAFT_9884 [Corynascus sepedonium]
MMRFSALQEGPSTHRLLCRPTRRPSSSSWKESSRRSTPFICRRRPSSKSASKLSLTRKRCYSPAMVSPGALQSLPLSKRASNSSPTT